MFDFLMISTRSTKRGVIEIYPKFIIGKSSDLMIRGGDFYAIWIEERKLWSTDEQDAIRMIDHYVDIYAEENKAKYEGNTVRVLHIWDAETCLIDKWHKYCQRQLRDNFHPLDEKLIFSNHETTKEDYATKKLSYPLVSCPTPSYDRLMSVLYSEEERTKIEWAIGAVVSGDSVNIQKFLVLYGAAGTGKSTVLNIIQMLFDGYYSVFDAKALGSSSNSFALEAFRSDPLVAIQHDGDLSRIEDNTRLNSLISHEKMTVNEKFKSSYENKFKSFIFVGTNKPVKITDAKSGLMRRLIDVSPTGNKLEASEYKRLYNQIKYELGGIAMHCRDLYLENPGRYDGYVPKTMMSASNDFYNYILENYFDFSDKNSTTLTEAWTRYNKYVTDAKVPYPMAQRAFKEELKNYFDEYFERAYLDDGSRVRNYFKGFKADIFEEKEPKVIVEDKPWLEFNQTESLFDKEYGYLYAQYANEKETPNKKWEKVSTKLEELDTTKLHYVKVPENHIVIDFDIRDENGNKSFELNYREALKWPKTYAELSKSGQGIHLHYIYNGDVKKLSRTAGEDIEIKVFTGNSSLRRKLSKCNDIPVFEISSNLPLKKGEKMINNDTSLTDRKLRNLIKKALAKEIHPNTKPSIDFIFMKLEEAYNSGLVYDVTDMRPSIISFAASSTNRANECLILVNKMHFKSEERSDNIEFGEEPLIFYDVEVFPNLLLINWKFEGEGERVNRMINPTPDEVKDLTKFRLIGFNCRRYDNHILYGRMLGYSNKEIYNLSQKIIKGDRDAFFGEAYNISYTDVLDFSSEKKSLKKFEIELGIHHKELGIPWDQEVPEERWEEVALYCDNDVIATEAVFNSRASDFTARKILADLAGMTVNDTTNSLTTRIIFGKEKNPQLNYRFMGDLPDMSYCYTFKEPTFYESMPSDISNVYNIFTHDGKPWFNGYSFNYGKSVYRDEIAGEGGYVYSEPGVYYDVALLDVASMHPSSIVNENLFGEYTSRFNDILQARIAIKHKDFEKARSMLDGKLSKYLDDEEKASELAQALKIAINSVYGLTSAKFQNPFRDIRNVDNIVAKRGALFMINLKHEIQERGFTVVHIKTDSIKIANATQDIIDFAIAYGKEYGYNFEHEATYERICLVNDAVYIARYKDGKHAGEWTATGTQFQVPYVFKTLFSKEPITFEDKCETKSVQTALYLDFPSEENKEKIKEYELRLEFMEKQIKKATKNNEIPDENILNDISMCKDELSKMHDYRFVGKVGSFCPVISGVGGGTLLRKDGDKYYAVSGTKGYEWLESETVKVLNMEDSIDISYYEKMVDDARSSIDQYCDFEQFSNVDDI